MNEQRHYPTPHQRPYLPIGAILVVVGLVALVLLVRELRATFDPIEREQRAAAAWEAQQRDIALSNLDLYVAAAWRVAPLALVAGAASVAGLIALRRWASVELLKADRVVALTSAQRQMFPAGLSSLSFHDSHKELPAPPVDAPELPAPAAPGIPKFAQLLDQGAIGPGRPLLLGYRADTGEPLTGSWSSLYSVGLGGMTGSGKSWLAAFLISQSAAAGARLIVIDPHSGDAESLANRIAALSASYMCDVASSGAQIEQALKLASSKLEARRSGRGGSWPLLLICDEWTSLLRGRLGDLLTATALDVAEQGRKYGVFAMLAAQAWQVDAAGPVRDRLASHYTMRTRGDQFRYQMGLRGSAPIDTLFLKPGEAYFLSVAGDLAKVVIPEIGSTDIARVAGMIAQPAAAIGAPFGFGSASRPLTPALTIEAASKQVLSTNKAASEAASSAPQRAISPEAARVYAEWLAGRDITELAKEANGGKTSGPPYQEKLRQINALLREATKGE